MTADQAPSAVGPDAGGRLVRNSAALAGSRLVVAGLGWLGTALIVRQLSGEEWGRFSFVFNLLGILAFVTDLGSSQVVLTRLHDPKVDRGAFAGTYVVLRLALGVLSYAVALLFVVLGGYPGDVVLATAVAGAAVLIASPSHGLDAVFQSGLRLDHVAVASVLGQLAQLALTVLVSVTRPTLLLFVLPAIAYDAVGAGWKLKQVRSLLRLRYGVQLRVWGTLLRQAAPVAVGGALATLYARVDMVLLSRLDDFEAVGRYGVAMKFATLASFLPTALTSPLLPLLVQTWRSDVARFHATVRQALLLMWVAAGLVLVAFLPFAADVVTTLYGSPYAGAADAARLAVAGQCAGFLSLVAITVLIAAGRNRAYVLAGLAGLVGNVAVNLVLIPRYSFEGAALASAGTAVPVAVLLVGVALRLPGVGPLPWALLAGVAACAGAAIGLGALLGSVLAWPLAAALAAAAYLGLLQVTRSTGREGLRSLTRHE